MASRAFPRTVAVGFDANSIIDDIRAIESAPASLLDALDDAKAL